MGHEEKKKRSLHWDNSEGIERESERDYGTLAGLMQNKKSAVERKPKQLLAEDAIYNSNIYILLNFPENGKEQNFPSAHFPPSPSVFHCICLSCCVD